MNAAIQQSIAIRRPMVFRFLWITKTGPRIKQFSSLSAFSGYIAEVRLLLGCQSVEFRTPTLCIGVVS